MASGDMARSRSGGGSGSGSGGGRRSGSRRSGGGRSDPEKRIVQPRRDGGWEVVAPDATRASAVADTQREAELRAKEILANAGGGECVVKRPDGTIRDSDTVPPGNDPNPPRDKKH